MILDKRLEFCDEVSLIQSTGTTLEGDVIDLENARDIGNGESMYLVIQITTEVDSTGDAATVNFKLVSDAQAAISTTTSTIHLETGALVEGNLAAGDIFAYAIPMEGLVYEQYVGILATVAGEAVTAGAFNAFLTKDVAKWKAYAQSPNVVP